VANGNTTPSRPGANNAGSDKLELFRKQFAGEVLTAYKNTTVMLDKHMVRTIASGKGADFPLTGVATAKYHVPGANIADGDNSYLNSILHGQRTINIDDLLVSPVFIANLDEAMNHYDLRSIYSGECGTALALRMDGNVARMAIKAARVSTPAYTNGPVGTVLAKGATVATTGSVLAAAIFEAAKVLDQKNVPENDRYALVSPEQYFNLVQTTDVINKDWGGSGVYADGKVLKVAGISIVKTNQLPSTDESAAIAGDKNGYNANFTNTTAVVFHKNAVGTVKLLDLAVESEYQIERQGWLFVAKYAMGHGILRPECAVEITKA
jgi:hypothetical protein